MKAPRIPATGTVRKTALPILLKGGPKAVLLLHGYTGHSGDMLYMAEQLNEAGFTVAVPRLPGHGTNGRDFLGTGARDWLRRSVDAYLDLKSEYETVYVGGLSMGGLLTIILASLFPIPRIGLFAPAVINTDWRILLTPFLRHFIKRLPSPYTGETEGEDEAYYAAEYWSYQWISGAAELHKLQKLAEKKLPDVHSDTLLVVSQNDRTVPLKVADLIEQEIGSRTLEKLVLDRSAHVVVNDVQREEVARAAVKWFSR